MVATEDDSQNLHQVHTLYLNHVLELPPQLDPPQEQSAQIQQNSINVLLLSVILLPKTPLQILSGFQHFLSIVLPFLLSDEVFQ